MVDSREIIDTFDSAKPRFLNRRLAPLSINPEHTRASDRGVEGSIFGVVLG